MLLVRMALRDLPSGGGPSAGASEPGAGSSDPSRAAALRLVIEERCRGSFDSFSNPWAMLMSSKIADDGRGVMDNAAEGERGMPPWLVCIVYCEAWLARCC